MRPQVGDLVNLQPIETSSYQSAPSLISLVSLLLSDSSRESESRVNVIAVLYVRP